MPTIYSQVLDKIIFFYEHYSKEHRACTQPFQLEKIQNFFKDYKYNCKDLIVREALIEHSGSLPIVAITLFPYIDNKNIDLGRALIMLAIHDIGELAIGDEIIFTKKKEALGEEQKQALKLLPKSFHEIYLEMEGRTSDTARFAKSIDKITPDIVDLITPANITATRYKQFTNKEPNEIVPLIKEFKHPYMVWNDFIKNLHLETLDRLDKKLKPFY